MGTDLMEPRELRMTAFRRFFIGALVMGALFFVPAGTIGYWQAWVYMAVLLAAVATVALYLIRNDPALLARRLRMREERSRQSVVQKLGGVVWLAIYLVPGFDQRFGWSSVPWILVAIGDLMVLGGYLLFFLVMKENSYASRIVQVEQGQSVITTGPYALVRHPMYLAVLVMLVFSPLALGSFWAMIPTAGIPLFLVLRIRDEEMMLAGELPGYRGYAQRTRYRLIPGVW